MSVVSTALAQELNTLTATVSHIRSSLPALAPAVKRLLNEQGLSAPVIEGIEAAVLLGSALALARDGFGSEGAIRDAIERAAAARDALEGEKEERADGWRRALGDGVKDLRGWVKRVFQIKEPSSSILFVSGQLRGSSLDSGGSAKVKSRTAACALAWSVSNLLAALMQSGMALLEGRRLAWRFVAVALRDLERSTIVATLRSVNDTLRVQMDRVVATQSRHWMRIARQGRRIARRSHRSGRTLMSVLAHGADLLCSIFAGALHAIEAYVRPHAAFG